MRPLSFRSHNFAPTAAFCLLICVGCTARWQQDLRSARVSPKAEVTRSDGPKKTKTVILEDKALLTRLAKVLSESPEMRVENGAVPGGFVEVHLEITGLFEDSDCSVYFYVDLIVVELDQSGKYHYVKLPNSKLFDEFLDAIERAKEVTGTGASSTD